MRKKYGDIGIGFDRDFVLQREGNPVFYVQNGDKGHVVENFDFLRGYFDKQDKTRVKALEIILGYLKGMSDSDVSTRDLKYYEEMEWRVVHLERLEGDFISVEDRSRHIYRLKLLPEDIKIIIFSDREAQKIAFNDRDISAFFKDHLPMAATLDECDNF